MRSGELREQELEQGSQQRFPSSSHVVNNRKEAPIQWQVVLCNASMRAPPRSQQGPKAFPGVDGYFMQAITGIIPRLFATAVTDACLRLAPLFHTALHVVRIRVKTGTWRNRRLEQGFDRPVLDVCQQLHHHRSTTRDHPEERWLRRGECAASAFPLESSAPAAPPFFFTSSGFPL